MEYDSEDEVEQFQVTQDDIDREFMPQRRWRKFTKEDAIYGLWADHDSDDERGRGKDYTRAVGFVSAGVQGGTKEEGDGASDSDEEEVSATEQFLKDLMVQREQRAMEKGGERAGVGKFQQAGLEENKSLHMTTKTTTGSVSSNETSKKPSQQQKTLRKPRYAPQAMDREFGKWERHNKGFATRMMQKMGWRPGQGLGKEGEGIVNPVKATKHTDFGRGIKMVSGQPVALADDDDAVDEEEEEEREFQEQLQQWRKTDGGVKAKPKYTVKTFEELTKSKRWVSVSTESRSHTAMKVIDRTGPRPRELSSYEEIYDRPLHPGQKMPEGSAVYMPELLHNIERLVYKTEEEIIRNDRALHYNEDLLVNLYHERESIEEELESEEKQICTLSEILEAVTMCESRLLGRGGGGGRGGGVGGGDGMSLSQCEELMTRLKNKYPIEYKVYDLSALAVAVAFPLIKGALEGWDILGKPDNPVPLFTTWRDLLRETDSSSTTVPSTDSMDPYDRLVWEIWMPKFRHTLSSLSLLEFASVIDLLETWMPLLPAWQMDNILDQMIMPRLQHGVQSWDPTTDTIPLHTWVHPWLPLMERRLELLYPTIRHKLSTALNNWHPSDLSAHKILEPWVQVFSKETMEAFVVRNILPKLAYCLQSLHINPHNQDIGPFEWVMAWRDMIPAHHYGTILDQHFFPKWMQILSSWLSNSPNYDEVTKWYSGWKSMLDPALLNEPAVKRRLGQALDMMNHAVSGTFVPGVRENMAYFTSTERRSTVGVGDVSGRPRLSALQNAISAPVSVSFKDVVEKLAEDHGVLFMPVVGQKRYEGKALYNFGRATIYIDRGVSFVSRGDRWVPVSLDELVKLAT